MLAFYVVAAGRQGVAAERLAGTIQTDIRLRSRAITSARRARRLSRSWPQREIADASFRVQEEIESGRRTIVGVNRYQQAQERELELLRIPPKLERKQIGRVQAVRAARDAGAAEASLSALREAAAGQRHLMEPLIDAARAPATEGEIVQSLQRLFGTYTETPVF